MANLRELRNRIASVKSTKKITSAMKMVAASRLRQAQEAVTGAGYYAASQGRIIQRLAKTVDYIAQTDVTQGRAPSVKLPSVLTGIKKNVQNHVIIVFSSSRGLCGGFNINVVKKAYQLLRHLEKEKQTFRIVCVGQHGYDMLKSVYADRIVAHFDVGTSLERQHNDAEKMSAGILDLYEAGKIDVCTVIYNHFHSAISQEVRICPLIPLKPSQVIQPFLNENPWGLDESEETFKLHRESASNKAETAFVGGKGVKGTKRKKQPRTAANVSRQYQTAQVARALNDQDNDETASPDPLQYDFAPENPETILRAMVPDLLATLIFRATLESVASENGARMTAMDNATNNAADLIDDLTLQYNRTRQAMITNELTEIISGAEAL